MLINGYFRNAEATAAALVDGWYRTGELAEIDDEGYYCIVGRVKDVIRTGGETVAPAEVDVVIAEHPAVADGAVAGVPDDDWGEIVTAFVVLRPGEHARPGRAAAPTARAGWPATSTPGGWSSSTPSPGPARPARSSAGAWSSTPPGRPTAPEPQVEVPPSA